MLPFKDYIKEAILRTDLSGNKTSVFKHFGNMYIGKILNTSNKTKIFTHKEYTVYKEVTSEGMDIFVVDKDKRVEIEMILHKDGVMHYVDTVVSISTNYKAHELYRDLIVSKTVEGLTTHEQSPGGRQIWDKLSKFPDITIFGWDPYHSQAINLGKRLPDEDETHLPLGVKPIDSDDKAIKRMQLVAIKKIK